MIENTSTDDNNLDTQVVPTLKYLSNCYRSLDLPLINCKTELELA